MVSCSSCVCQCGAMRYPSGILSRSANIVFFDGSPWRTASWAPAGKAAGTGPHFTSSAAMVTLCPFADFACGLSCAEAAKHKAAAQTAPLESMVFMGNPLFARAGYRDWAQAQPSVPKILEPQIHLQLVLLAAHHLDHRLQIVAALAGDADGLALDRPLDLELAVLDRLDDRLRFLRLDPLHEAEHLRDVLPALLEGSVLEPAERDAALGHLLHQHRARGLQALLRGAADLQPLLRRGDLFQRRLRPLEVVSLIDLLAGLLERVVDFLLVHLADDVEARHVTSPGRPAAPSAVSPGPSSRRSARRGGGPLPPFRDRCAGRERARRARRAPPVAPAPAAIRRGRRRLFPGAPARAPPRRSCDPGRRGRPASRSRRGAGGPEAPPRRRRRNRRARRGRAGRRTPRSGPPRRSRPCAAPPRRHPPRSRRPGGSRPPPPRCARALRACGTRRGWGRSCADAPGRSSSAARPDRHDRSCVPARSSPCCWT